MKPEFEHAVVGVYRNAEWVGTAFFINCEILLTAGHVFAGLCSADKVTIRSSSMIDQCTVEVIDVVEPGAQNGFIDYALLRLEKAVPRRYLMMADKTPKKGSAFPITVLGFRSEDLAVPDLEIMTGLVTGSQNEQAANETAWSWTLKLHFEATPGFSGAPLLDEKGVVFGILASRKEDSAGSSRKTIGVPIRRIIDANEDVARAMQSQQFGPHKHPKKEGGQRIQHQANASIDLVRVLWTARPHAAEEPGRRVVAEIRRRLAEEMEVVRGAMRVESPRLRKLVRPILWEIVMRDVLPGHTWRTYFGPDATFPVSDPHKLRFRVIIDAQTSLPQTRWREIPLDHDDISHGILIRIKENDFGEQGTDNASICIPGDETAAVTETVARIVDAFLDINLFYRFHHLHAMFPTAAAKARFDGLKQDYIARHPTSLSKPLSIASLSRSSWESPPEGGKLVALWTEFVQKHVQMVGRRRGPRTRPSAESPSSTTPAKEPRSTLSSSLSELLVQRISSSIESHPELVSRISRRKIRREVKKFRPMSDCRFVIFGVIVDKPVTHRRREDLMKLFHLPVWKMQGASARLFEMTERAALNSLARHVAVLVIPTDPEA